MAHKRILIVGGTGMLGHKLAQVAAAAGDIETHVTCRQLPAERFRAAGATYHSGVELGVEHARLSATVKDVSPDFVLNAAGAIKHRDLSSDAAGTLFLNGALPHALAAMNPNPAGRVIHFSTDCVFTGAKGDYREADQPDAGDLYGLSKAAGELRYAPHLTIRTSIIGFELANHLGLLAWFMRQPQGSTVKGYTRAIFSGLPTVTLSRLVLELVRGDTPLTGLYHVASEPIAKVDLLTRIRDAFQLDRTIVPSSDVAIDRSLDDTRFRDATGTSRPGWDALIEEMKQDYQSLPYDVGVTNIVEAST
ncbi:MAG: sugar nucleotide-binding protein [Gemmatimonadota bacterium]